MLLVASFGFPKITSAAALTSITDAMTREQIQAGSNHEIRFTTPTGVDASSDTITLTFASGFNISTITFADIDLMHGLTGTETNETIAATAAAGVWGAAISGETITLTAPTDAAVGEIAAGHKVDIRIGLNAAGGTQAIANPSLANNYVLSIGGTFGDIGSTILPILSTDKITVIAVVPDTSGGPGGGGPGPGGPPDATAPAISNIRVVNITQTDADVMWDTDESADSRLSYGTTPGYEIGSTSSSVLVTSHLVHLSGLTASTTYHFFVQSKDAVGNNASSLDQTFRTALPPAAPVISNIRVVSISDTSAIVLWDTDVASTSVVKYGLSIVYNNIASTPGLVTNHAVLLTGLSVDTLYHFFVLSTEGSTGLTGISADGTFRTLTDTTPPANPFGFIATPGNAQVRLDWTNPTEPDFSYVRIVARTDRYPSGPTDGRFVYEGTATAIMDNGLTNGTRYYYANYAFDGAGNQSSGAFAEATPTSTAVVIPPPIPPTPTTTPPIPPIPPTPTTTPPIPPVIPPVLPPPIPTPAGAILYITPSYYAAAGAVELSQDPSGMIGGVVGMPILVRVSTIGLGALPLNGTITVGGSVYALTPGPAGTVWSASFIPALAVGDVPALVVINFTNGARAVAQNTIQVRPLGRVTRHSVFGVGEEPVAGAKVTLYDAFGSLWSGLSTRQPNPVNSGADGSYVFFVPNGHYRVVVTKDGFKETVRSFQVLHNIASVDVALLELPKTIGEIVTPEAPFGENVAAIGKQLDNYIGNVLGNIQTPENQAVAEKVIAPTVLVVTITNTAIAISGFNLWNYLQYVVTQPVLLFSRRKRKKWGSVYNSLTKQPIDLAIVRLIHVDTNLVVLTRITDAKGRFSFIVRKGKYRIEAVKQMYVFPSLYLKGQKTDVDMVDLYQGEVIVAQDGATLTPNIPMDPIASEEPPHTIQFKKTLRQVQDMTGFFSVVVTMGALIVSPSLFTGSVLLFQVVFYLVFRRLALPGKPKGWGLVVDANTKKQVDRTIVRIFDKKFNKLLETQITGKDGKYSFYVGKSVYYVTAEHPGYDKFVSQELDLTKKAEPIVDTKINLTQKIEPSNTKA